MKIVRLFSFIMLIGAYLSADSNIGNLPAPIPIDFGENIDVMQVTNIFCSLEGENELINLHYVIYPS